MSRPVFFHFWIIPFRTLDISLWSDTSPLCVVPVMDMLLKTLLWNEERLSRTCSFPLVKDLSALHPGLGIREQLNVMDQTD